jgi:hypothetical protein
VTLTALPIIDWRRELEQLAPFLAEKGGVVQVQASDSAPASTFAKAIRRSMANEPWPQPWRSVQIEEINPNTHYLEDVVLQLERSLALEAAPVVAGSGGSVEVVKDVRAQAVYVSDVSIEYAEDEYSRAHRSLARLDHVADALRHRLAKERVALIVLNSHAYDRQALVRFRTLLWDERLQALTDAGLLLIDIGDRSDGAGAEWPPPPDLVLQIPERFDDASRAHAREDLAQLALDEEIVSTAGEAQVFARTLLASCDTVRELHARLAGVLLQVASGA